MGEAKKATENPPPPAFETATSLLRDLNSPLSMISTTVAMR